MEFGVFVPGWLLAVFGGGVGVWVGGGFEPAFQGDGGGDDEFRKSDVLGPGAEEFGQEFLHFRAQTVLVCPRVGVGFRGSEGCGKIQGGKGGGFGRF